MGQKGFAVGGPEDNVIAIRVGNIGFQLGKLRAAEFDHHREIRGYIFFNGTGDFADKSHPVFEASAPFVLPFVAQRG